MSAGFQAWDATGALKIDASTRVGHLLGSFTTGTSNGSTTFDLSGGTPFAVVMPLQSSADYFDFVPQVTFSGNTVTWNFDAADNPDATPVNCLVLVGKY